MLTPRTRARRSRSDLAIGLSLLAILLANTLLTGSTRLALVYGALATACLVAIAGKRVWLSAALAVIALAAVVLSTMLRA